ncbi:hypothetical protein CBF60_01935 [Lactobacillus taiwanensis]|uniref:HK97 gp10 family phage protein n=1 Tax=Lactobacillus taiwanensis TaxID=508451 RepID=UPI000B98C2F9|nr:HK97 gp10 family phage protein [Lactobacillus taiwanensis]OYS20890.1 hypothetical protein CBF76_04650 [Lactobacillus taiwanensis]OYS24945.1 hypothetical protein CBF55_03635 [Lactobacillus taiwanensis]OYS26484.1 hypothetical protein CBF66_00770 [Lactobacillus taiwanensis]OYS26777.1 hypothetical protein CBF73_01850 [Lactobacillus taiwanensis]OYS29828.1 hypothetical protein CBF60_01935 [Lactobacillus taiwanensis]
MSLGHVDDAQFQQFASRVRQKIDSGYVKQELGKSSKRIGTQSLRILKANTPVKQGNLRRSWTAEGPSYGGGGWTIKLINNAEYASWVESGHRQTPGRYVPVLKKCLVRDWVPGQWYMKKSIPQIQRQLPQLVTEGLWGLKDLFE